VIGLCRQRSLSQTSDRRGRELGSLSDLVLNEERFNESKSA